MTSTFQGWPKLQLKTGAPSRPLEVQELGDGLFVMDNAFYASECQEIIKAAEAMGMIPTNPHNRAPGKGEAFRNNER